MDDLLRDFLQDTGEHVERAGAQLARLEKDPSDRAMIAAVMRLLQAIRGTSEVLRFGRVQRIADAADNLMARLRAGAPATPEAITLILAALDRIETAIADVERRGAGRDDSDDVLLGALAAWGKDPDNGTGKNLGKNRGKDFGEDRSARRSDSRPLRAAGMCRGSPLARVLGGLRVAAVPQTSVALAIEGRDVPLDAQLAEALRDPLERLVKFCAATVEPSDARIAAGKSATATIRVSAAKAGQDALIDVRVDGAMLDLTRLGVIAIRRGLLDDATLAEMGVDDLAALILVCGMASEIAPSWGDSLDGVHASIATLGGTVVVHAPPGDGTGFTIRLPRSAARLSALVVIAGGQRFALPCRDIVEIVAVGGDAPNQIARIGEMPVLAVGAGLLPAIDLAAALHREGTASFDDIRLAAIVRGGDRSFGILIEAIGDVEQIPARTNAGPEAGWPIVAGETRLLDGSTVSLLDPVTLAASLEAPLAPKSDRDEPRHANGPHTAHEPQQSGGHV